jgi:uncharacterized protein YukJ
METSQISLDPATGEPMSLSNYGVLKGTLLASQRESEQNSPHYQLHLLAGDTHFRVPVNVKSVVSPSELLFLVDENFQHPLIPPALQLAPGFTPLESKPGGLALDFIRGNLFDHTQMRLLPCDLPGEDNDLQDRIEHFANRASGDPTALVYAFGTRWGPDAAESDSVFNFLPGNGVHNIHMNQGNAAPYQSDDGVYQDGALLIHFPSTNQWVAMFLAFQSQSWHTDDASGHSIAGGEQDLSVRIIAALVNPPADDLGQEKVILLNTTPDAIDLQGWALLDKFNNKHPLSGALPAGAALTVALARPIQLSNKGSTITLLNPAGLKVHGVSYTAAQAAREGWTIVF